MFTWEWQPDSRLRPFSVILLPRTGPTRRVRGIVPRPSEVLTEGSGRSQPSSDTTPTRGISLRCYPKLLLTLVIVSHVMESGNQYSGIQSYHVYTTEYGKKYHLSPTCASNCLRETDPLELYGGNINLSGVNEYRLGDLNISEGELCKTCFTVELYRRAKKSV